METRLNFEIDGETATEYDVIIGCSIGAESEIGCDGEWISGYVVTRQWLLTPDGGRLALGADERRAEERESRERGRRLRAAAGLGLLIGLWAAALAVTVLALAVRGG